MNYTNEKIVKKPRQYFPPELDVTKWENVEKELKKLEAEEINSAEELIVFLEKVGELSDILDEEQAWRYIKMTRFADNEKYQKDFNEFYAGVISKVKPYNFKFNKKFYESPFRSQLDKKKYSHLDKIISNDIELFREENIPLKVKEREIANNYGSLFSKLTAVYKGEEKTLSQLSIYLKDPDRKVREEVWFLRMKTIAEQEKEFNKLFDEMKKLRIQQAKNAGFDNYRDYAHQSKGRFAYTPEDLLEFHNSVEKVVLPFLRELTEERRQKLNLESVRPWDTSVELDGKTLKPFRTIDEFIDKAIEILYTIKPKFGLRLNMMKNSGYLDLENRKGKAPGGYNYPLQETGAPFIFMNAVGLHRDVVTLLHESGHAMHTFSMKHIKIDPYKNTPSEVAELASMAMEFISMDLWNKYYPDENDYKKAKREQLKGALSFLPWCMIVDAFQHWIYLNPEHTPQERENYFASLMDRFNSGVNWHGLEQFKKILWLFQLHIFEVPFYYIEYGMSQLGALAIYRNYKKFGKEKALENYENFLKLGYTKPVNELYETAGIKFDFSEKYIRQLVDFVKEELEGLK
ncbi:MAG: M3 family oligoendopeptidase [Candidatus Cloacimonadota bacterium]|nr:MAG: M3 family oligoendopeptidase [Candidatus Cloacimonadota bacterium]